MRSGELVGERNLEAKSCEDLAGAAAVNLVLLMSSTSPLSAAATDTSASDEPSTSTPATEPLEPEPEPEPEPELTTSSPRTWRIILQLPLASLEFGPLPQTSWGLALATGLELDHWRILAEGHAWLRQELEATSAAEYGARLDRIAAGVRICHDFQVGGLAVSPCVNASMQHLWARGTGPYVAARTAQATWIAAGLGAQARLRLTGAFGLVGGVDAQIETARPRISVDGLGPVGQLGAVAVRIALGTEWIF